MVSPQHHTLFTLSSYPLLRPLRSYKSTREPHGLSCNCCYGKSSRTDLSSSSTRFVAPRGVFQVQCMLVNLPTSSESVSTRSLIGYERYLPNTRCVKKRCMCPSYVLSVPRGLLQLHLASSISGHVYKRSRMTGKGSKTPPFNRRSDFMLPDFTRFHCITVARLYRCRSIEGNTWSRRVVTAIPAARTIRRIRAVHRRTNEQRAAMLAKMFQSLHL